MVTGVIVQAKPWYTPQYFILLGDMIIGNSMNTITIALDRMFADFRKQWPEIELALCLGSTYQEATHDILRDVIKAGMIPSINALTTPFAQVSVPMIRSSPATTFFLAHSGGCADMHQTSVNQSAAWTTLLYQKTRET